MKLEMKGSVCRNGADSHREDAGPISVLQGVVMCPKNGRDRSLRRSDRDPDGWR